MKRAWMLLTGWVVLLFVNSCSTGQNPHVLTINTDDHMHTLAGGMGASWHSMSREIPLNNHLYKYPVRDVNPRGSGYAGNPPVTDKEAWKQVCDHAAWLGMNWFRVELSQRMYEPERKKYDWDNEEMQALYNILDHCDRVEADVFLQQMWSYVDWNSYPGVHPLLSAPRSLDDHAESLAELLLHLIQSKGYTCIKYLSILNEPPGGTWGYWWSTGEEMGSLTPAWKRVREELRKRDIHIPISAPDWTNLPPFDPAQIDFDEYNGAYDIHSYRGVGDAGEEIIKDWVRWAHDRGKPFFLTEFGNMNLGWGTDDPGPKTFAAALSNTEDIIRGLRNNVDAFNRWSFTNRGDMDGQWQLVQTYDRERKVYLSEIKPEREAYYGYGILTRFLAKYATRLGSAWTGNAPSDSIFHAALMNPDGNILVYILNRGGEDVMVDLGVDGENAPESLYLYQVTEEKIAEVEHPLNPMPLKGVKKVLDLLLPAKSITTVTSIHLEAGDKGIITVH